MQKSTKRTIIIGVSLLVLVALAVGIFLMTRPATQTGAKEITVEVVLADGTAQSFTYNTDEEYLGAALLAEGLIEGDEGPYGMFITSVNGVEANADNEEWWSISKDGEMVDTGIDTTPIADGDKFELTLMVGW